MRKHPLAAILRLKAVRPDDVAIVTKWAKCRGCRTEKNPTWGQCIICSKWAHWAECPKYKGQYEGPFDDNAPYNYNRIAIHAECLE